MTQDITRVLVVDDESSIREVLTDFLVMEGYDVVGVADSPSALAELDRERFHGVLLDLKMPGMNGIEVLQWIKANHPRLVVVMMTGFGTVETAIEAMKAGAYDYIMKPFKVQDVIRLLARALSEQRLEEENIQLKEAVRLYSLSEQMSATLKLPRIYGLLAKAARDEVDADAVMVWSREGDGWEVAHRWSRSDLDADQVQSLSHMDIGALVSAAQTDGSLVFHGEQAKVFVPTLGERHLVSLLCVPMRSHGQMFGMFMALSFERNDAFREGKRKMLSILCGRASASVENAGLYRELQQTFKQTIQALANLLEDKDPYTRGHSDRVSKYARMIAKGLGLSEEEVEDIADCALMHDIGKLGIRYEDLNKVEPLTEAEYEMFKSHTTRGKWILEPIKFLHHLIPGVYHHHERWDGKGYPLGLKGEEIPLVARILAIADTYDAMTSHRAYRRALPHDVAIREIQAFAGAQFDPDLVEVFLEQMALQEGAYQSKAARWEALKG